MKTKIISWLFAVIAVITSMHYTAKPAYAWGTNRPLYARIKLDRAILDLPVDQWRFIGASECIEVIVNGRKYVTHASNVLIYEK